MPESFEYRGYLIKSQPNELRNGGWGAQAAILRINPSPTEYSGSVILDRVWPSQEEAYWQAAKAAKAAIDTDDLP